ncbi:MAG: hypothetical protein EXR86_04565 [Gammaproteobacteria bacterium]|nr:hypothetical protein [Gammaproteobacteria bacterium]
MRFADGAFPNRVSSALLKEGVTQAQVETLLVANPRRFFQLGLGV